MARAVAIVMLAVFAVTQAILWAGLYTLHRIKKQRVRANPLLRCPHCDAELVRIPEVVASRRCPACRKRVLAEPAAGTAAAPGESLPGDDTSPTRCRIP